MPDRGSNGQMGVGYCGKDGGRGALGWHTRQGVGWGSRHMMEFQTGVGFQSCGGIPGTGGIPDRDGCVSDKHGGVPDRDGGVPDEWWGTRHVVVYQIQVVVYQM